VYKEDVTEVAWTVRVVDKMKESNNNEKNIFKEKFCKNDESRNKIMGEFNVSIESFEEAAPWQEINSWATGSRKIKGSYIIFKVVDEESKIIYYPVFSEPLGRKMLESQQRIGELPTKINIFSRVGEDVEIGTRTKSGTTQRKTNPNNLNLRVLIMYVRSLMLLDIPDPKPMTGMFKDLYDKLNANPSWDVWEKEIKSVNTALSKHLAKANVSFTHLDDFCEYLTNELNDQDINRNLRTRNFQTLKEKFLSKYPDEKLFF